MRYRNMSELENGCGCGSNEGCGSDCGCGHEEEMTVTLTLDDNTEVECAVVAIFPVNEKDYIALLPLNAPEDEEGEVYLYRFSQTSEDAEPTLENIEDDEEYEAVADAFDELLDDAEFDELMDEE